MKYELPFGFKSWKECLDMSIKTGFIDMSENDDKKLLNYPSSDLIDIRTIPFAYIKQRVLEEIYQNLPTAEEVSLITGTLMFSRNGLSDNENLVLKLRSLMKLKDSIKK